MSQPRWPQPFSGAPPIPTGYNVNPQLWQAGQWQPNPRFNWNQYQASQVSNASWIPGAAWAQQGGASHNPYKRVPKPPSAEYLATELSDNPLGLTNMIPREQLYGPGVDGALPETPWIWNPRNLDDNGPREARQAPGPSVSARRASEPSMSSERPPAVPSASATASGNSSRKYELPDVNGPLQRPRMYQSQTSTQIPLSSNTDRTQSSGITSASAYAAASAHGRVSAPTASSAPPPVSPRTLRTTFSTRIVRTPDHYRGSGGQDHTDSLVRSNTMPSIDSVTSGMERMSSATSSANHSRSMSSQNHTSSNASRHSSSNYSMSGVPMFVDEPSSMLSPLVIDDTPIAHSAKPLGRHHTAPALSSGLSSIPETSSSASLHQRSYHQSRSSRTSSQPATPALDSTGNSKVAPRHDRFDDHFVRSNSQGTSSASAAATASRVTSPNSSSMGDRPANPLPTPPRVVEVSRYSSPTHSGTTARTNSNAGSSSTVTYTTTTGHGSSSTSYNVIPTSSSIPLASASASASVAAAASVSRTRSRSRPRERERSRSGPPDSSVQSPEGVRSNEIASRSRDSIQFAPEGMRANPTTRSRHSSMYHFSEVSKSPPNSDIQHFPLPAPPESFLIERKRQEQEMHHHQSTRQMPQRSPQSHPNPSPQRSPQPPSARAQRSPNNPNMPPQPSPQRHSPNPSPNAPQRSPFPSPYSVSSSQPSPTHGYSQAHGQARLRAGFWNIRGDHLTESNHIVYAPPHHVYPPELKGYPGEFQGYRDQYGNFKRFEVGRPELEESLPRMGKPAVRPYESFIKYI